MSDLATRLLKKHIAQATRVVQWPESYVHSESGRVYTPHNAEEEFYVYSDSPKYMLIKGGEGCIAAETLINDIPAAEWSGGTVNTILGPQFASPIYPKGTAGLYRVQTRSGYSVTVTLEHRFLTPHGWCPLESLGVGHLIAVRDRQRDPIDFGKSTSYQDGYSRGFHPYGGLPNPQVADTLDKWRQLASFPYDHSNPSIFDFVLHFHPYRKYWPDLWAHYLLPYAWAHHVFSYADATFLLEYQTGKQLRAVIDHLHKNQSFQQFYPHSIFERGVDLIQYLPYDDDMQHLQGSGQQFQQYPDQNDPGLPFLQSDFSYLEGSFDDYNTGCHPLSMWDEIDSITFVRYATYYDLSVPGAENYLANGIYHHNSGKSVALIIKILNRLRRGMSGAVLSPNLPSFKRSLWPELLRWLPRSVVIDSHQRYFAPGWLPRESFNLVVHNEVGTYSTLLCASAEAPRLLEGPNLNFVAMDEIRGMSDVEIMKVMQGRIRIVGPRGEPSQIFCSSTPAMHWMFDYFGPANVATDAPELASFKAMAYVATVTTEENEKAGNVEMGYVAARGAGLTEEEKQVRLSGEWVNEDNPMRFMPEMITWDILLDRSLTPPRKRDDPKRDWSDAMVLAVDASVSRDYTAIVGLTRNPKNRQHTAVRLVKTWNPIATGVIDFEAVETFIRTICKEYHVVVLVYDDFQMENMAQRLFRQGVVWTKNFNQQNPRTLADQFLFDSIFLGSIAHMGDATLREHVDNANVKMDPERHKKRIIKRTDNLKIDALVALSMGNYECARLNI